MMQQLELDLGTHLAELEEAFIQGYIKAAKKSEYLTAMNIRDLAKLEFKQFRLKPPSKGEEYVE